MVRIVFGEMAVLGDADLATPDIEANGFPQLCFCRTVSRVENSVDHIAVIEGLLWRLALLEGVEDIGEHVIIPQVIHFVAYREEPAAVAFGLLGDIVGALAGGEHLETGSEEVIDED